MRILKRKNQQGVSLLELMVVLLVTSILASMFFVSGKGQVEIIKNTYTRDNLVLIQNALTLFMANNGRLPCPASLTVSTTDASYGLEQKVAANPDYCQATGIFSVADGLDEVYIGAIPFKTLGLPASVMMDGWDNKIDYVVQKAFINNNDTNTSCATSATNTHGVVANICFRGQASSTNTASNDIFIYNFEQAGNALASPYSAAYVLLSHGANGLGAFPNNDTGNRNELPSEINRINERQNTNCPATASSCPSQVDHRNFVIGAGNSAEAGSFDDLIAFQTRNQLVAACNMQYAGTCANTWGITY